MSVKIHNGIKFLHAKTLSDVKRVIKQLNITHNQRLKELLWSPSQDVLKAFEKFNILESFIMEFAISYDKLSRHFYGVIFGSLWSIGHCLKHPAICEYAYYDNTDKPEHISDAYWEERRMVWARLIQNFKAIDEQMFIIKIRPDPLMVFHQ